MIYNEAEKLGLTPLYYYQGFNSICLLIDQHNKPMARGVAMCSSLDAFSKSMGRRVALSRALRAVKKEKTDCWVNVNRFDIHKPFIPRHKEAENCRRIRATAWQFGPWKSVYQPTLLDFEEELVNGKK